jgi:cytochrome d ubiquinol oxidase subunit I
MRVQNAATGNTGLWITFLAVVLLYLGVGVTTVLVLRGMSRRYREQTSIDDSDVPYGPRAAPPTTSEPEEVGAR